METPETIKLLGGRLCLDFANSVDWTESGEPLPATDALTEPGSLERWARRLRLDEPGADPLPRVERAAAAPPPPRTTTPPEPTATLPPHTATPPPPTATPSPHTATPPEPTGAPPEPTATPPEPTGARPELTGASPELAAARELRASLYLLFSALAAGAAPPAQALAHLHAEHAQGVAAGRLAPWPDGSYGLAWPPEEPRRVRFAVAADAVALLADADALARLQQCPGRNCGWFFLNASGRRRWCSMDTCGSRAKMRRMYARRRTQSTRSSSGRSDSSTGPPAPTSTSSSSRIPPRSG